MNLTVMLFADGLFHEGLRAAPETAAPAPTAGGQGTSQSSTPQGEPHFDVRQYRVIGGNHLLPRLAIEEAVYPYLGPYRVNSDVEQARAALEKAYHDQGYQTVTVQIPPQQVHGGVIMLQVVPEPVGRLRVTGSRYFSLDQIKREAPSLAEGFSPNFSQVTHDLQVLNDIPDRRITPTVSAGKIPGTVDVDLHVKDTPPVHGSLELNNRYSADSTHLRLNGSVSYDNLWQLEHSVGFSFQLSPQDLAQVEVFSAYYLARIPGVSWLTLLLQGTVQDSNVNTLGGIGVAGKGDVLGGRAVINLPPRDDFYHSISFGVDYKHFTQDVLIAGTHAVTPVTYFPLSTAYSGTWTGKGRQTELNASVNLAVREIGSDQTDFDLNRHGASGNFIYFRGDLSHTHDLPEGFQIFVKAQGQATDQPLLNSEQFSGGGLGTVRGYLESEELGDNGLFGSVELRTPSLGNFLGKSVDEWRFYAFSDAGMLGNDDPLPEQQTTFRLASVGVGTRIRLLDHFNGSLDIGVPLDSGPQTRIHDPLFTFRVWAEF
jgi:hemolysin activation/secretion protein